MSNIRVVQHRPFLTPIWITAAVAAFAFLVALLMLWLVWLWGTANSTTVIVIRHAEKETVESADPKLTDAGEARAALLAKMFGDPKQPGRIDAIYVTNTIRSQQTAAPLAAKLGIKPVMVDAEEAEGIARRALREHSGGRALIVAHSDTVPRIVKQLSSSKAVPDIDANDFGEMYVVTVPRIGRANLLRLHY